MDINKASAHDLEQVGQIDGERARYLIEHRERERRFESWQDVKNVRSYEEGMVERLQEAGFSIGGEASGGASARAGDTGRQRSGRGEESESQGDSRDGGRSINRASAADLEDTHMIDGERARRLVDYRDRHGRFESWDQVKEVSGIDDGMVERLRGEGFNLG